MPTYTAKVRALEDTPSGKTVSTDSSLEPCSSLPQDKPVNPPAGHWRAFAAVAVGTLLGMPFVGSHTVHAAWAELTQFIRQARTTGGSLRR